MALDFTELRASTAAVGSALAEIIGDRVTASDLEAEISKSVPAGSLGHLPFIKQDGTRLSVPDYLLKTGSFVNTAAELAEAKLYPPNNAIVFNNWKRFSHEPTVETQPAQPSEITAWTYNSSTDAISNPINTASVVGVASTRRYVDYELEILIQSTNADDDNAGVLLAWVVDGNGREHTLSAIRSPGGFNFTWAVYYNYGRSDQVELFNLSDKIRWGNGGTGMTNAQSGYVANTAGQGWSDFPNGTRVHSKRTGDLISVVTTEFQAASTYVEASRINIDLTANPLLEKFRGPRSYGYIAWSQADTTWKVLKFDDPADYIYDLSNGNVHRYQISTASWIIDSSLTFSATIGHGRLMYNPRTGKSFFYEPSTGFQTVARSTPDTVFSRWLSTVNVAGLNAFNVQDIPAWAKKVKIFLNNVSSDGSGPLMLRLGIASGLVTAGNYRSTCLSLQPSTGINAGSEVTGFALPASNPSNSLYGVLTLEMFETNFWTLTGHLGSYGVNTVFITAGAISLGALLTQISLYNVSPTQLYDTGSMRVQVEGVAV